MKAKVKEKVKGGYLVSITAFLPASESHGDKDIWLPDDIVGVIPVEIKKDQVVVSHKVFSKQAEQRVWGEIEKNDILEGRIRNIHEFGIFVNLGTIDGLAHKNTNSISGYKKGDLVKVKVLSIRAKEKKIALELLAAGENDEDVEKS